MSNRVTDNMKCPNCDGKGGWHSKLVTKQWDPKLKATRHVRGHWITCPVCKGSGEKP